MFNNGKVYEGEWKNLKREGRGILRYRKYSMMRYDGEWKNNMKEGTYYNYDINEAYYGQIYGSRYEGGFKNDMKEGHGTTYVNGQIEYEGEWKNDMRHGKGTIYYKDGSKYEGEWKNHQEGKGTFYFNYNNVKGNLKIT
jgi:hypothetical protein